MGASTEQIPLLSDRDVHSLLSRLAFFTPGLVVDQASMQDFDLRSTRGFVYYGNFEDVVHEPGRFSLHLELIEERVPLERVAEFHREPVNRLLTFNPASIHLNMPVMVGSAIRTLKDESTGTTTRPIPASDIIDSEAIEAYNLACRDLAVEATESTASLGEEKGIVWDQFRLRVLSAAKAFGEETDADY